MLLTLFVLVAAVGQAHAVGYRYWSFWQRDGARWTYATEGPSTARPADGEVQGFRFAVSADSADAQRPRGDADFGTICAGTPARGGAKRVALVLDFGTAADAPAGETPPAPRTACARVAPDATTAEALASVAPPLRYDTNALLCAITGYPAKGCGDQIADHKDQGQGNGDNTPAPAAHKNTGGPSVGLLTGAAAVLLLTAAALWQTRRRRHA
ncbi:SCO2322 family protein [Streptomyces sp. NPDC026672]|uniref:SCO2322 family protein n=1 Tax=unclassified Streptomyces TaxID=2593676 RepID=UPI0033F05901